MAFPVSHWFDDHRHDVSRALYNWVDESISRMESDLRRSLRSLEKSVGPAGDGLALPLKKSLKFRLNRTKNIMECDLATGCGDYFRPEDISLTVSGRNVEFQAKREEKSEDGKHYTMREVHRTLTIPDEADLEKLQANLCPDGRLVLEAPLLHALPQKNGPVPIQIKRT